MQPVVTINNINLDINKKNILKECSLVINKGEVLSVLGTNGSGKSSLLSIILGDQKANSGNISYFPSKRKLFKKISTVYDNQLIFPQLKVKEVIQFFCKGYGVSLSDFNSAYLTFGLDKISNSLIKELSQGERVKVNIFIAILPKPELLIMDEPFAALDPTIKDKLWQSIKLYCKTIVYTTHDWVLAESYSDKIMFIKDGQILYEPLNKEQLLNLIPSDKKILVQDPDIKNKNLVNCYSHEDKVAYLLYNKENLNLIKKQTNNFSILDTTIKDVYLYLSKN